MQTAAVSVDQPLDAHSFDTFQNVWSSYWVNKFVKLVYLKVHLQRMPPIDIKPR